jgi:hypothetical protein
LEKIEEINQELKQHISTLERSNEEHKRLVRKRDKELEQIKTELEHNIKNASLFNHKVFFLFLFFNNIYLSYSFQYTKQDLELNTLRNENLSLNEELKLMRENVNHCQEEQRRLRKDCDQALNFIHDGIPEFW